jgi:transposase
MPIEPPKCVSLTRRQIKALKERIKARTLAEQDYDVLQGLAEAVEILGNALKEKDTALGRLCKYLFGAPTETARNILKKPEEPAEKPKPDKKPGHGRKPAAAYTGGEKVVLKHPSLNPGDHCPECHKGKVYELALPSVSVHFKGGAPLKAKVVTRERLRCNLCGEVFAAELPEDVSEKKHDESAAAMLAILKYGCGFPLNRLERLQSHLGQPLAASTQWDILNASAITLAPVVDAMIECAAQGHLIHNDDTTMKVLELLKQTEADRKGVFTTGIVSHYQGHRIALFMTGHRHAGENLTELLKRRATGLAPPIQMCDALSRNASKDFETILSNCLAHARRQFVEIVDRFPDDCAHVIEKLGKVYHQDEITKKQGLSPEQRLGHHQEHSKPVMDGLKAYCEKQIEQKAVEPNSGLGKAINYMLRHWEKLTRFLTVPGAPLDNNICERILKFAICHRKNALFYKTQHGAQVGDLFMSLIHTCQFAGVNPLDYLTWLFQNAVDIQKAPHGFLPWDYQPP